MDINIYDLTEEQREYCTDYYSRHREEPKMKKAVKIAEKLGLWYLWKGAEAAVIVIYGEL
jgi:hypothetical protein